MLIIFDRAIIFEMGYQEWNAIYKYNSEYSIVYGIRRINQTE
jgi:hypothetical protein